MVRADQAAGAQIKNKKKLPPFAPTPKPAVEGKSESERGLRETLHPNTTTNTTCLPGLFFSKVERQIQPLENSLALTKNTSVSG